MRNKDLFFVILLYFITIDKYIFYDNWLIIQFDMFFRKSWNLHNI